LINFGEIEVHKKKKKMGGKGVLDPGLITMVVAINMQKKVYHVLLCRFFDNHQCQNKW